MKTSFSLKRIAASTALIVAGGFLAASPAMADIKPPGTVLPNTINLSKGVNLEDPAKWIFGGFYDFTYSISGQNTTVHAGMFPMSVQGGGSFATYCVELGQSLSEQYNTYNLTTFDTPVATGLARLYQVATTGNQIDSQPESAAFQAAIWEITRETSPTAGYSLSGGNFTGSFLASATTVQANLWLAGVNTFGQTPLNFQAMKYANESKQDLLVITAVPEPETYAMLLAGLGLMATIARRRKA